MNSITYAILTAIAAIFSAVFVDFPTDISRLLELTFFNYSLLN